MEQSRPVNPLSKKLEHARRTFRVPAGKGSLTDLAQVSKADWQKASADGLCQFDASSGTLLRLCMEVVDGQRMIRGDVFCGDGRWQGVRVSQNRVAYLQDGAVEGFDLDSGAHLARFVPEGLDSPLLAAASPTHPYVAVSSKTHLVFYEVPGGRVLGRFDVANSYTQSYDDHWFIGADFVVGKYAAQIAYRPGPDGCFKQLFSMLAFGTPHYMCHRLLRIEAQGRWCGVIQDHMSDAAHVLDDVGGATGIKIPLRAGREDAPWDFASPDGSLRRLYACTRDQRINCGEPGGGNARVVAQLDFEPRQITPLAEGLLLVIGSNGVFQCFDADRGSGALTPSSAAAPQAPAPKPAPKAVPKAAGAAPHVVLPGSSAKKRAEAPAPAPAPAPAGDASRHSDQEAAAILRSSVTSLLFRGNGFRILELPVNAGNREIARRKQTIEMAARNELEVPPGPVRILPLDPAPDEYAVREAVQRLGDPEKRIVDELFWFWPQPDAKVLADPCFEPLLQGQCEAAASLMEPGAGSGATGDISLHNLAVLRLFMALEAPGGGGQRQWAQALAMWDKLLVNEAFWSRFVARVREYGDPRLTAGTVHRMREGLPAALLAVAAAVALAAAERGDLPTAVGIATSVRDCAFDAHSVRSALGAAVNPICSRIKSLCTSAEQAAGADPVHADRICSELLDGTEPLLAGLDCLLAADDPRRKLAHDDVAENALRCQVAFSRKTNNWAKAALLLERASKVALGEGQKAKMKENLETVRKYVDSNDDFCGDGYFDLPPEILEEMEAARKLSESNDHDGSISRLEKLIAARGKALTAAQRILVNKALAYCLGCRAAKRVKEATSDDGDTVPRVIQRIVERVTSNRVSTLTMTIAQIGTIPAGMQCDCMACGMTIYGRYTVFKFREVPMLVCGSCGDSMRSEQDGNRQRMRTALTRTCEDLVRAKSLDPKNNYVSRQVTEMRSLCGKLDIPFPSVPVPPLPAKPGPKPVQPGTTPKTETASSGCFIATAAYGTPLAAEIDVLRHYRDTRLSLHAPGRWFVRCYGRYSPPVARCISVRPWLCAVVRACLNPLVRVLAKNKEDER